MTDANPGGEYYSTPKTEWLSDSDGMKLLEAFRYKDPAGRMWTAPSGSVINGASIPRIAWAIVGSPYQMPYRDASIIHDHYCDSMERTWEETHRVFYDAMLTSRTSESEALIKYWAVVRGGPRWDDHYRWSGLWPFKVPRAGRDNDAAFAPSSVAKSAVLTTPSPMLEETLLAELNSITMQAEAGTLSPSEIRTIVEQQIDRQPDPG